LAERFTKQPALDLRRSHDEGPADHGQHRQAGGSWLHLLSISIIVACVSVSRTRRATKQDIWPSHDDGFSLAVVRAGRKFFKSCLPIASLSGETRGKRDALPRGPDRPLARLLIYSVDYKTFHELRLHFEGFLTGFCKLALCFSKQTTNKDQTNIKQITNKQNHSSGVG
jgi:hypothetical protein